MVFENDSGLVLGAMEAFLSQHEVAARLSVVLQWKSSEYAASRQGPMMYTPIVRGSPYSSMVYEQATPRLYTQRGLKSEPVVDGGGPNAPKLRCGNAPGVFSSEPVLVQREIMLTFDISDMTWLIFVSEPTEFVCSNNKVCSQ